MVALGAEWTAELADRLGEKDAAAARRRQSQSIFAAMRARMWDDAAGTFRPFDLKTGERGFESAEGFYMFADRALSPDVRRKLLASLTGPRFGWARIPLTSMAVDSPCYTNTVGRKYAFNASWSGNVWTLVNRWTVYGLLRSGCALEAVGLARATVGLIVWAESLYRATGEARFYDVIERALYNLMLSSVTLSGENSIRRVVWIWKCVSGSAIYII